MSGVGHNDLFLGFCYLLALQDLCENVRRQREAQLEFLGAPTVINFLTASQPPGELDFFLEIHGNMTHFSRE